MSCNYCHYTVAAAGGPPIDIRLRVLWLVFMVNSNNKKASQFQHQFIFLSSQFSTKVFTHIKSAAKSMTELRGRLV